MVPASAAQICTVTACSATAAGMASDETASGAQSIAHSRPLRFGVLGAANINAAAIIHPCQQSPTEAAIVALAARDPKRAQEHIEQHGLTGCQISPDYQSLVERDDIDAVYNPSPNGLHFEWTMAALRAGKHVLCEKPFASNAEEARQMVALAAERNLVLMEAFHWFYHPLRERIQAVMASGELGTVSEVNSNFMCSADHPSFRNKQQIRYNSALAGGTNMDLGTYALDVLRTLMGRGNQKGAPKVLWAEAKRWEEDPEIDDGMAGELQVCQTPSAALPPFRTPFFLERRRCYMPEPAAFS